MIHLRDIWRGHFSERRLDDRVTQMGDGAERASGYGASDHQRIALTSAPKGLPASELDAGQRDLLRALLATYTGRVPDGLSPQADYADDAALDAVHLAWAGPPAPASRSTTGCRARGCSSSTTTPSARPTTPTRCGVIRPPTSATTPSARTWRSTI